MNLVLNMSMQGIKPTGLGVYSNNCLRYLDEAFFCTIVSSACQSKYGNRVLESPPDIVLGGGRMSPFKRHMYLASRFPKEENSFLYSPTHHGVWGVVNQVITIHDLIPIHHPQQHKIQYLYYKYFLPSLLKSCKAVFTVSETSKDEICNYYDIDPSMVHIIPNCVNTTVFCRRDEQHSAERYLLMVGAAYPHKNIHEVLNNWLLWKGKYTLKIASARGEYGHYLEELVQKYRLQNDVQFLGYVTQRQLIQLYQSCSALVFPSLWEGFGLPPIEALACGRPVIASDILVHKEVLQEAAFYITPGNYESWKIAFAALENERQVEEKLKLASFVLNRYTARTTGKALIQALVTVEPRLEDCMRVGWKNELGGGGVM